MLIEYTRTAEKELNNRHDRYELSFGAARRSKPSFSTQFKVGSNEGLDGVEFVSRPNLRRT